MHRTQNNIFSADNMPIIQCIEPDADEAIYNYRKKNAKPDKPETDAQYSGNIACLINNIEFPGEKIVEESDGEFLHSEIRVIFAAYKKILEKEEKFNEIQDINNVHDKIKAAVRALSRAFITKNKKDKNTDNDNYKKAMQDFVHESFSREKQYADLLIERNRVLKSYFDLAKGENIISTEREPCADCKKTLGKFYIKNNISIRYTYILQGQREQTALRIKSDIEEKNKNANNFDAALDCDGFLNKATQSFKRGNFVDALDQFIQSIKIYPVNSIIKPNISQEKIVDEINKCLLKIKESNLEGLVNELIEKTVLWNADINILNKQLGKKNERKFEKAIKTLNDIERTLIILKENEKNRILVPVESNAIVDALLPSNLSDVNISSSEKQERNNPILSSSSSSFAAAEVSFAQQPQKSITKSAFKQSPRTSTNTPFSSSSSVSPPLGQHASSLFFTPKALNNEEPISVTKRNRKK